MSEVIWAAETAERISKGVNKDHKEYREHFYEIAEKYAVGS